ncbi:hypothetical protein IQ265_21770 [Nodosilinea sp. LEGE 06152]|uniref:hypothetical protein n=1 Tax=Nodosilinea sp. LEGE 06152 TaxID=2777966 RepID=UPI0018804A78|nr:hypothetical protein [Nodosilinea sp. LEGE 06152]MBE9159437.1 hypothetical protein [Nodosilinea sp. LEGE 06152]
MPRLPLLMIGSGLLGSGLIAVLASCALALPPPDEIPEEVLRTEVITEARSPIDGKPISAADYAALQARLRDPNTDAIVDPDIASLIQLLQLRRVLRPILPFLP